MTKENKKMMIGVDIGGTKVLTCLLNNKFNVIDQVKESVEVHKKKEDFLKTILSSIEEVLSNQKLDKKNVASIGIGCPGIIQNPEGIIKISPNIKFLEKYPLK